MDCSPLGSSVRGILQEEYWWPFLSPVDLPDPGIKPWSLALQAVSLSSEPPKLLSKNVLFQFQSCSQLLLIFLLDLLKSE